MTLPNYSQTKLLSKSFTGFLRAFFLSSRAWNGTENDDDGVVVTVAIIIIVVSGRLFISAMSKMVYQRSEEHVKFEKKKNKKYLHKSEHFFSAGNSNYINQFTVDSDQNQICKRVCDSV